ncbi:22930_t:CDS:2, partial [Cetraspora pellucida]
DDIDNAYIADLGLTSYSKTSEVMGIIMTEIANGKCSPFKCKPGFDFGIPDCYVMLAE